MIAVDNNPLGLDSFEEVDFVTCNTVKYFNLKTITIVPENFHIKGLYIRLTETNPVTTIGNPWPVNFLGNNRNANGFLPDYGIKIQPINNDKTRDCVVMWR